MRKQQSNSDKNRSISYRKTVVQQNASSKIKEGFMNFGTNLSYKLGGGISVIGNFITKSSIKKNRVIWIQGKQFSSQKQASNCIRQIIWFSYRRIPGLTKQMHCDTGWGCLIRVGQMALASIIKLFLLFKFRNNKTYSIRQQTIISFLESGGKNQKYSLRKIVQKANKLFGINYGQWFKVSQICDTLVSLHKNDPMKNLQNLDLIHFKNSTIYLDQVFQKMKKLCVCQKRRVMCNQCNVKESNNKQNAALKLSSDYKQISQSYKIKKFNRVSQKSTGTNNEKSSNQIITIQKDIKVGMFISCRPGVHQIGKHQYEQVIQILEMQCCLGIIGGIPKKGLFFVGHSQDQLVYLDPHFVQDEVTPVKFRQIIKTFETGQIRTVKRTDIDPSMAFVLYIDSLQTLKKVESKIQDLNKYDNPIISITWEDQNKYLKNSSGIQQSEHDYQNSLENSYIQEL